MAKGFEKLHKKRIRAAVAGGGGGENDEGGAVGWLQATFSQLAWRKTKRACGQDDLWEGQRRLQPSGWKREKRWRSGIMCTWDQVLVAGQRFGGFVDEVASTGDHQCICRCMLKARCLLDTARDTLYGGPFWEARFFDGWDATSCSNSRSRLFYRKF